MPNHVTTRCIVTGPAEDVARFRAEMIVTKPDENGRPFTRLDFEVAIPMPSILKGDDMESTIAEEGAVLIEMRGKRAAPFETGGLYESQIARIRREAGLGDQAHMSDVATAFLAKNPRWEAAGRLRLLALLETDHTGWYSWSIAHWGTKWNSYSFRHVADEPLTFLFDTAWSFPTPVFEKIAATYPSLSFFCATYDEGANFAGVGYFNPPYGCGPFTLGDATDALYEEVHGHPPDLDDDDEDGAADLAEAAP